MKKRIILSLVLVLCLLFTQPTFVHATTNETRTITMKDKSGDVTVKLKVKFIKTSDDLYVKISRVSGSVTVKSNSKVKITTNSLTYGWAGIGKKGSYISKSYDKDLKKGTTSFSYDVNGSYVVVNTDKLLPSTTGANIYLKLKKGKSTWSLRVTNNY